MSLYFFHLSDAKGRLLDPEGVALAPEAVEARALDAVRELLAADVRAGRLDLNGRIEVVDESGTLVFTQTFASAIEVEPLAPEPIVEIRLV